MRGVLWPVFLLGTLCIWADQGCGAQAMEGEARSRGTRSIPEAVTEQRYYLRRLFGNYGQHSRLSPEGLHRLFESLGLGQVQVVEIEHEELGHGHVSHLDALDLQERRHVHSHTTEDHLSMLARGSEDPTWAGTSIQGASVTTASRVRSSKWTSGESVEPPLFRKDSPAAGGRLQRQGSMFGHRLERSPRDHPLPVSSHGLTDDDRAMNHSDYNHLHGNCLNATQLLVNFGMSSTQGITPKQFTYICPALLYQIDSRVCIQHHDSLQIPPQGATQPSVWICGFVAVTLISLTSLLAVAVIPLFSHSFSKVLLRFLVTLAIGTLSADALLHLIPHSSQLQRPEDHVETGKDPVWKGLSVLGGIYLLFLIETLLGLVRSCRGGKVVGRRCTRNKEGPTPANMGGGAELQHLRPDGAPADHPHPGDELEVTLSTYMTPEAQGLNIGDTAPGHAHTQTATGKAARDQRDQHHHHCRERETGRYGHGHSHGARDMRKAGIATIAWMVIVGDGAHNFTDGLAIGAAFSTGISGGLSTTIAVLCHELPHELGDFAMLLQAGLHVRKAVLFNLVSAVISYLGLAVGIAIGQHTAYITPWIFTSTAGIFLYVSLVDMLPEMLHTQTERQQHGALGIFLSQNLGFLFGVGVMLCIALFEDKMHIDISF
ncbi:zinc transporter ZIP10-like [Hemiscyllium ocellatum]|uniref:zinc transporter ZIP10-like n=2 Tax=Hemiscyllium ocellatum TaxID=170820 RepID=UPI0029677485|nr:zinc transporter ZIP10-like [Hemiscyllium ocellatum]